MGHTIRILVLLFFVSLFSPIVLGQDKRITGQEENLVPDAWAQAQQIFFQTTGIRVHTEMPTIVFHEYPEFSLRPGFMIVGLTTGDATAVHIARESEYTEQYPVFWTLVHEFQHVFVHRYLHNYNPIIILSAHWWVDSENWIKVPSLDIDKQRLKPLPHDLSNFGKNWRKN